MTERTVNVRKLESHIRGELRGRVSAEVRDGIMNRLATFLSKQPPAPALVSRKEAARILGVQSPNIARFSEQGRMPEPVEVEGSAPVYLRSEVEDFARTRKAQAKEAAAKRREKEGVTG